MSEHLLAQVALLGARIDSFHEFGVTERGELCDRRLVPALMDSVDFADPDDLSSAVRQTLPLWVHNAITDPTFPRRSLLLGALMKFSGEISDNRDDGTISLVLMNGFGNKQFDPLNLPDSTPMRQRCAIVAQLDTWRAAYRTVEAEFSDYLGSAGSELMAWCSGARVDPDVSLTGS